VLCYCSVCLLLVYFYLSPGILLSFLACCFIALDKQPGVRLIRICEAVRRIVAEAALAVIRTDIQAT